MNACLMKRVGGEGSCTLCFCLCRGAMIWLLGTVVLWHWVLGLALGWCVLKVLVGCCVVVAWGLVGLFSGRMMLAVVVAEYSGLAVLV